MQTPNERATSELSFDIWVDPPGLLPYGGAPLCVCDPFVHNNMSLCTVVMSTSDTKGCATMGYKPRWVNPYIKRKL